MDSPRTELSRLMQLGTAVLGVSILVGLFIMLFPGREEGAREDRSRDDPILAPTYSSAPIDSVSDEPPASSAPNEVEFRLTREEVPEQVLPTPASDPTTGVARQSSEPLSVAPDTKEVRQIGSEEIPKDVLRVLESRLKEKKKPD